MPVGAFIMILGFREDNALSVTLKNAAIFTEENSLKNFVVS